MSVASRLGVCGALSLMLVAPVRAQEHENGGAHGEALGRVVFPVSCRPDAQVQFERAMALLHSFWWEEGARAFRAVAAADSTCAMAYWGLALNYWGTRSWAGPRGTICDAVPPTPYGRSRWARPRPESRAFWRPSARCTATTRQRRTRAGFRRTRIPWPASTVTFPPIRRWRSITRSRSSRPHRPATRRSPGSGRPRRS